jgi:hypothetical protein
MNGKCTQQQMVKLEARHDKKLLYAIPTKQFTKPLSIHRLARNITFAPNATWQNLSRPPAWLEKMLV